jgi:hypothetical protein
MDVRDNFVPYNKPDAAQTAVRNPQGPAVFSAVV